MLAITEEQYAKYIKGKSRYGIVYKITNIINENCYIGSSQNFIKRYYTHLNHIRTNKPTCKLLIKAVLKYGEENFKLEILEECEPSLILTREQFYLDKFLPKYNIAKIAGSALGIKRTKEVKLKKSLIQKNNWNNSDYRKKHLEKLSKNWKKGENHLMAKITEIEAAFIKKEIQKGFKPKQISDTFGFGYHTVKDIYRNKTWKHVVI